MIAFLEGKIIDKNEKSLTLLVNGVGYLVYCPSKSLEQLKIGQTVGLHTHLDIGTREETIDLYGFVSLSELEFFKKLIKISGVGPRSALAVLSIVGVTELAAAISQGDFKLLQKVSGIGRRTAERIVMELKDKLKTDWAVKSGGRQDKESDIFSALEGLGYKISDIRHALRQLPSELKTSEERIKAALKILSRK